MFDRQEILDRHGELVTLRQREEKQWRDIARILRPDDKDFEPNSKTERNGFENFDSTPLYALDDFAGGLFGEATNPAERWMEFTLADQDLAKYGPVKKWLWDEATNIYASLSPAVSQFYLEAPAWFSNVGAFGNSFMYSEQAAGRPAIVDRACPIGEMYCDTDSDGLINQVNRRFNLTSRQMRQKFLNSSARIGDKRDYQVIHAVYPNPDFRPGMMGPRGAPYLSTYVSPDLADLRADKHYYEMPYHYLGWNRRSGRPWCSGPGHNARSDMNMLNEMERSNLVSAQFAAEPMMLLHEDSTLTAQDIYPRALIFGGMNDKGKELAKEMQRGDNPQRAEAKTEQKRQAIKEAFLFSIMQVVNRPQMTATEFMGWKQEKYRLLGPYLVRVQAGLASLVARRFAILQRAGQISPPPPELARQQIALRFVSPLAKAQEAATGQSVLQWVTAMGQVSLAKQDPSVMDIVNGDGVGKVLHSSMVKVPDVINSDDVIAQIRKIRADAQQQNAGMENAANAASVFADVAHAKQAMTSSKNRPVQ